MHKVHEFLKSVLTPALVVLGVVTFAAGVWLAFRNELEIALLIAGGTLLIFAALGERITSMQLEAGGLVARMEAQVKEVADHVTEVREAIEVFERRLPEFALLSDDDLVAMRKVMDQTSPGAGEVRPPLRFPEPEGGLRIGTLASSTLVVGDDGAVSVNVHGDEQMTGGYVTLHVILPTGESTDTIRVPWAGPRGVLAAAIAEPGEKLTGEYRVTAFWSEQPDGEQLLLFRSLHMVT